MEEKVALIKRITAFHPGSRPEKYKHYGWYVGGMRDTGDWRWPVMIDEPISNLRECLHLIENPPHVLRASDDPNASLVAKYIDGLFDKAFKGRPFTSFDGETHDFSTES